MLWTERELRAAIARYLPRATWRDLHELFVVTLRQQGLSYARIRSIYRKMRECQLELGLSKNGNGRRFWAH